MYVQRTFRNLYFLSIIQTLHKSFILKIIDKAIYPCLLHKHEFVDNDFWVSKFKLQLYDVIKNRTAESPRFESVREQCASLIPKISPRECHWRYTECYWSYVEFFGTFLLTDSEGGLMTVFYECAYYEDEMEARGHLDIGARHSGNKEKIFESWIRTFVAVIPELSRILSIHPLVSHLC